MKKILFIILLAALTAVGLASADRTAVIRVGYTQLSRPMVFTAADSIVTSDSLVITVTNLQAYLQYQTMTTTLTDVDGGSPSVVITLRGRTTSTDDWHVIGTPVTWTSVANNPATITSTGAVNYNYLKVSYVASGATQHLRVATFDIRTANTSANGNITLTAGYDLIGSSTSDITINTNKFTVAGATGNTVIGGTLGITGATTATGLITANGGVTLGAGDDLIGSSTSDITINTDKFTVAGATGNTVIAGTLGITGATTATGLITANGGVTLGAGDDLIGSSTSDITINTDKFTVAGATGNTVVAGTMGVTGVSTFTGGFTFTNVSPVIWAKGGSVVLATAGTDAAATNGDRYWVEVDIPYNVTLTGIAYLVGSVGGTDSVIVELHNSAGAVVASSVTTGATHGAIVGTAAQFQSCPFSSTYAAIAGKYYASVQFNGTTAKFRAYPIPGSKFITGTAAGTYDTAASITPGTTFTADKGPILMTY